MIAAAWVLAAAQGHADGCPRACEPCARAVERGLAYILSQQNCNGSWGGVAGREDNAGVPAYSMVCALALLAEGSSPAQGAHAAALARFRDYALGVVAEDGSVQAGDTCETWVVALTALALSEIQRRDGGLDSPLQHLEKRLEALQTESGGWFHGARPLAQYSSDLVAATNMALLALAALRGSGVPVPQEVIDRALAYYGAVQNEDGGLAYGIGHPMESLRLSEAGRTAGAVAALAALGLQAHDVCRKAADYSDGHFDEILIGWQHGLFPEHFLLGAIACERLGAERRERFLRTFQRPMVSCQEGDGSFRMGRLSAERVGGFHCTIYETGIAVAALQLHLGRLAFAAAPGGAGRWRMQASGTEQSLLGVSFSDERHGWAAGEDGVLLATEDGETWAPRDSGVRAVLQDVHAVDRFAIWAAGVEGRSALVLRSADGGRSWRATRPGLFPASSVHAFDADAAWIATYGGPALPLLSGRNLHEDGDVGVTADGGGRWESDHSGPWSACRALFDVVFVDRMHGFAAGSQPLCVKAEECVLGRRSGAVLATVDGGRTWRVCRTPIPPCTVRSVAPGSAAEAAGLRLGDVITGLDGAPVADYIDFKVARYPGLTLALQGPQQRAPLRLAVRRGGEELALAIGGGGSGFDCKPDAPLIFGLAFADASTGWAVGEGGTVLHTADAGQTWESQPSGTTRTLRGVDFVDSRHGWAVGDTGTILRTDDGGRTWEREDGGTSEDLYRLDFVSLDRGWAVGNRGTILRRSPD